MPVDAAFVRDAIGVDLSDAETSALVDWYRALATGVAAFPQDDLVRVEPPLISTAGPAERA